MKAQETDVDTAGREQLNVVIVGHVDHGKSTVVGRLLADTHNLPEGKLEAIRERCQLNSKPMEYAYLLDALKDEQAQGITIDTARCFFKTDRRDYIIIDAPGHIEFLKNMVSGAARADAALLVIDAHEGVQENSRRHGYFLSMLGIEEFAVVVNKMDLVGYDQAAYDAIVRDYQDFMNRIHLAPRAYIPVNAREGANLARRSADMPWYTGPTVREAFDQFVKAQADEASPLRFPVQDVYKFTAAGDERRIVAGRLESGSLRVGDRLVFLPSNKRAVVQTIEAFNRVPPSNASVGQSIGVTLSEQLYVMRGDLACREGESMPHVSSRLRADLFWLGRDSMQTGKTYKFKLGTSEVPVQVEQLCRILDASNLQVSEDRREVRRHEVAECILRTRRPVAFDLSKTMPKTGRFVIVDGSLIAGGGIVREALPDEQTSVRDEVLLREQKWVRGDVTPDVRAERYAQRPALILVTGSHGAGRKTLARAIEKRLFAAGRLVYYLGMGSVVYGVDADLRFTADETGHREEEHVRRLGELLHVLLDAGLIVVCTAQDLTDKELNHVRALIEPTEIVTVGIAEGNATTLDFRIPSPYDADTVVHQVVGLMKANGIIPAF